MCELLGNISDSFWAIYYTLVEAFGRYIGGGFWAVYILVEAATEETHCERPPPPPPLILQFRRDFGKGQNQSVTNIFGFSNILATNIYSYIHSYQFVFYEYIRTFVRVKFVCTNIFGHSLVSVLECKT